MLTINRACLFENIKINYFIKRKKVQIEFKFASAVTVQITKK